MYADGEDQRGALGVFPVSLGNGVRRTLHSLVQLSRRVISGAGMYGAQIVADIHPHTVDVAQIAVLDAESQVAGKDDVREHRVQPHLVAPVGGGGKSKRQPWLEIVQYLPVGVGRRVVGFIHDYGVKGVRCKLVQPPHQRLYTGAHYLLAVAVLSRPLHAVAAIIVFHGLAHQLLAVGQNQVAALPWYVGKRHRLAQPRGHLAQVRPRRLRFYGLDAFALIIAQFHVMPPIFVGTWGAVGNISPRANRWYQRLCGKCGGVGIIFAKKFMPCTHTYMYHTFGMCM